MLPVALAEWQQPSRPSPRPAADPLKPHRALSRHLRLSWHAHPGGNSLMVAGTGGWEEVCHRVTPARAPATLPTETPHVLGGGIPAAPAPPGQRYCPGWYSGRRHPRRCGEMDEAKASPARAPPRHGRLRRPESHPQPRPVSAPFLCRSRAQLIPTTVGCGDPVPHRQNYVGGYVFTQRLGGQPVSNLARPGAGPALPVSHSIRIFAGDVRALPSSVSMPGAIVGGMLRPGWRPESGGGE